MTDHRRRWLADTDWLAANLSAPDLRVIDGSWYLPAMGRDAKREFEDAHIPGAVFLDLDDVSARDTDLPHMLPRPEVFSSHMRRLGVGDGQRIVVYDGHGLFSAPRIWWMFRAMGVEDVMVLDGGLPKWIAEGRATDDAHRPQQQRHFSARRNAGLVADRDDVARALQSGGRTVIDARPAERFSGMAPEPREGVRSGHEPGTVNLPFSDLVTEDGTLKTNSDLARLFSDAGIDASRSTIAMCGSGVTAAIPVLAMAVLGRSSVSLYDGSWAEWGREAAT
ncbi:MAG: 3-mercaptopyruvate sulfurtransferase [Pseudomonadota bacterium]